MKRALALVVTLPLAIWLTDRLCYIPYRCNNEIGAAVSVTGQLWAQSGQIDATIASRRLILQMDECLRGHPDTGAYMVAAANLRILRRPNDALQYYRRALKIDRRPEVYLQIGNTLMEMGDRTGAIRYYMMAVSFNPQYIYDRSVLPQEVWDEVYRQYVAEEQQFRDRRMVDPSAAIE